MEYKKLTEKFGLWVQCEEDGLALNQDIIDRFYELFTSQIWLSQDYADQWYNKRDTRLALVMDALRAAEQLMRQSHEEILGTAGVFQEPVWVVNKYPGTSLPCSSLLLLALTLSDPCGTKPKNVRFPEEYLHREHEHKPANDVPALVSSQSWNFPCDERNKKIDAKDSLLGCVPLFEPVWFLVDLMNPGHEHVPSCTNKAKPPLGEIVVVDPMRGLPVLKGENQGAALSEVFNVLAWVSHVKLHRQRLNVEWNTVRGTPTFPESDPLEFRHLTPNGYTPQ